MYRLVLLDYLTRYPLASLPVMSLSVTRRQDEAGEWSATIPQLAPRSEQLENRVLAQIWNDRTRVLEGLVETVESVGNQETPGYQVAGSDELGLLARNYRGHRYANYQDVYALAILHDLISRASGWRLGDVQTITAVNVKTTLDLTKRTTIFSQIHGLLEAVPGLHIRYGGYDYTSGYHLLDVGHFGDPSGVAHTQHEASPVAATAVNNRGLIVGGVAITKTTGDEIQTLECYGGVATIRHEADPEVPESEPWDEYIEITLQHALNYNAALATDSSFPIISNNGALVIRANSVYPYGGEVLEFYDDIVPQERDDITDAILDQTGYALYLKGKQRLMESMVGSGEYAYTVAGSTFVKPGDTVHLRASATLSRRDSLTGRLLEETKQEVDSNVHVVEQTLDVSGNQEQTAFRCTDSDTLPSRNLLLDFYDATRDPVVNDKRPITRSMTQYQFADVTVNIPARTHPDTTLYDGTPAKRIALPVPTPPGWATNVALAGYPFSNLLKDRCEIESEPTLSQGAVVKIAIGDGWNVNLSTTIYARLLFT